MMILHVLNELAQWFLLALIFANIGKLWKANMAAHLAAYKK